MKLTVIFCSLFIGIISSCGSDDDIPSPITDAKGNTYFEAPSDLVKWHSQNSEVLKRKDIGDFNFECQALSADLLALNEMKGNIKDSALYKQAKSHYQDLSYFKFVISNERSTAELLKYQLTDENEYSKRLKYCAFNITNDFHVITAGDTVQAVLHEFERTFNVNNKLTFMVAFPKIIKKEFQFVYEDNLFKNGYIKINFNDYQLPYLKQ